MFVNGKLNHLNNPSFIIFGALYFRGILLVEDLTIISVPIPSSSKVLLLLGHYKLCLNKSFA